MIKYKEFSVTPSEVAGERVYKREKVVEFLNDLATGIEGNLERRLGPGDIYVDDNFPLQIKITYDGNPEIFLSVEEVEKNLQANPWLFDEYDEEVEVFVKELRSDNPHNSKFNEGYKTYLKLKDKLERDHWGKYVHIDRNGVVNIYENDLGDHHETDPKHSVFKKIGEEEMTRDAILF